MFGEGGKINFCIIFFNDYWFNEFFDEVFNFLIIEIISCVNIIRIVNKKININSCVVIVWKIEKIGMIGFFNELISDVVM